MIYGKEESCQEGRKELVNEYDAICLYLKQQIWIYPIKDRKFEGATKFAK